MHAEHQGHWLCKIHDASEDLYEACKAVERAVDLRIDLTPALRMVKQAIAKAESHITEAETQPAHQ